ncbi:hypothetical protein WH91_19175 [Devosia psychrophila]|uniref:Uncharacterized protein n=1 Tax=Devosia psychrophila TaxID=728005 RepID=A0ABR5DU62_9HYPH|nr:hypothetical protein WH91_19175 [Devosia psychrophila]
MAAAAAVLRHFPPRPQCRSSPPAQRSASGAGRCRYRCCCRCRANRGWRASARRWPMRRGWLSPSSRPIPILPRTSPSRCAIPARQCRAPRRRPALRRARAPG